jgi:hypothetical protein
MILSSNWWRMISSLFALDSKVHPGRFKKSICALTLAKKKFSFFFSDELLDTLNNIQATLFCELDPSLCHGDLVKAVQSIHGVH